MKVLIQEDHDCELVSFEIIVKTGSIYEGGWQGSGIAHLTEHMLFKGTSQRPVGRIEEEIRSLGGTINGYTSFESTGFTLTVPSQHFEQALAILNDMLRNPAFDKEELKKEKEVILNEIRMNEDDPHRYLQRIFWSNAYQNPPYNLPVIGLEPLFKKLKQEDLLNFYNKYYLPNNIIFAVAGDLDTTYALDKISDVFADYEMRPFPQKSLPGISSISGHNEYEEEFDLKNTYLAIGFESVAFTHRDAVILDVIATILTDGESSLMYNQLIKQKKLVYSVNAYNYTPGFRGVFEIICLLDYENKDLVIAQIMAILKQLKTKRLAKGEVEKAKNKYLSEFISAQETVSSQVKVLISDEAYTGNPYFSRQYLDFVNRLGPEDIYRCAQKYFSEKNFFSVVLKPKTKKGVRDIVPVRSIRPLRKVELDNGLRLLIKNNQTQPVVSLQVCIGGGTRWENESTNGIFNLMSNMLTKGTKKRSALAIAQEIEQLGAQLSTFSGYNSWGLSLQFLSKDIVKAIEICADVLLHPKFPEKELQIQKSLVLKDIQGQNDDIFQDTLNKLKANLFKNYPYQFTRLGEKTIINSIKQGDLVAYYNKFCRPNNMVISVYGDVDEDKIISLIKKKFAAFALGQDLEQLAFDDEIQNKQLVIENIREKQQAVFMIGFPGCSVFSEDRLKVELLSSLLCGPGGILYQTIREKYGLSYTLGGNSVSGLDTGYFFIYAATTSEGADKIKRIINEEIEKIKNGILDENLIQTTKTYLIGQHRIKLQTNSALSFLNALDELYGLGADNYLKYENKIRSITLEQISRVCKQYLQFKKSVIVITKGK